MAVVGPLGAATASAQAVTVLDDTVDHFSAAGPQSGTVVRTLAAGDGAVELTRTLETQFDGAALPAGWTASPWPSAGTATVAAGALLVDGARADSGVSAGPGSSLEFTATLGAQPFAHVGFGTDFDQQPWAMFSTGPDGAGKVYARTSAGPAPLDNFNFEIPGVVATLPHHFRIDWTASGFDYYVDDNPVPVSHAIPLTAAMRPQASEYNAGSGGVSVDSMILNTHTSPGTFTSRALDAGDARVTTVSFTPTSVTPTGATIAYETRTAKSTADLATATWAPLGAGGAVASPAAQYLQYRATLTTSVPTATPRLDKVEVGFTIDNQAPVVTIDDVAVTGASAKVKFSSDDANAAIKCQLDAGSFGDCTSPATFSGLADGSHTVVVQATDAVGNVGSATKKVEVDTHAPTVTISDVAVSGATARVTFSSDDGSAVVTCKLDTATFQSCASPASFSGLAAGSHAVVVKATDAHGNVGSATRTFDVAVPSGGATTPPPADVTAPKVRLTPRSVLVSRRGIAKVRVSCPRTESRCAVTVELKLKGKTVARKTLSLPGNTTRALNLRLSRAARSSLAARSHVKVTALVTASDAAGNNRSTQLTIMLRGSSR